MIRVAAAQYPIEAHPDLAAWQAKLERWVAEAATGGAGIALFPEYGAMEMVSLFAPVIQRDLAGQLHALQDLLPDFIATHRDLAERYGIHIVASSFPVRRPDGSFRNRAHLIAPDGAMHFQEKLVMTRFETEEWGVSAGEEIRVFETALGRIGIAVCYDVEFPLIGRALVEGGADVILVPSCTDTEAGYHRVRIGAQARALENQCLVVQSPTVGDADWSPAVDRNVGRAGAFAPIDRGFPSDGVLAEGKMNRPQWLFADLDVSALARVRVEGQVLNHRDWPRQHEVCRFPATLIEL
jgi:predicted amidohydrolase